jgi:hypothetical protein
MLRFIGLVVVTLVLIAVDGRLFASESQFARRLFSGPSSTATATATATADVGVSPDCHYNNTEHSFCEQSARSLKERSPMSTRTCGINFDRHQRHRSTCLARDGRNGLWAK